MTSEVEQDSSLNVAVSVALMVIGATWVTALAFNKMPWLAIVFGVILVGVSRKMQKRTEIGGMIFGIYGTVMVVLGVVVSVAVLIL